MNEHVKEAKKVLDVAHGLSPIEKLIDSICPGVRESQGLEHAINVAQREVWESQELLASAKRDHNLQGQLVDIGDNKVQFELVKRPDAAPDNVKERYPKQIVLWSRGIEPNWYFVAELTPNKVYEGKPTYATLDHIVRMGSEQALGPTHKLWKFIQETFDGQETSSSEDVLAALGLPIEDAQMPLAWHINRHLARRG